MDERPPLDGPAEQWFHCPGQSRPIERAVHLSRLAAFDPACLTCSQRNDTVGLTRLNIEARAQLERRASTGWMWTPEGPVASECGQLDGEFIRRFSFALADILWLAERRRPRVHVGSGSHQANELLAGVCRDLELAGCIVCEVGTISAPCLSRGISRACASGGIWIGNASGRSHEVALLAMGEGGIPWSDPGRLTHVRSRISAGAVRPQRSGGSLVRHDATTPYLADFRDSFHALRALAFVIHTDSRSLRDYLERLQPESALHIVWLEDIRPSLKSPEDDSLDYELSAISHEVVLSGAHFGYWIDGAGECCQLVDERGQRVAADDLSVLLKCIIAGSATEPPEAIGSHLGLCREHLGGQMLAVPAPCLLEDGRGRYWFAGRAAPDGLAVLCKLLRVLSRSDLPLSEVLDAVRTN